MGNCASQTDKDEKARSDLIDRQLEDDSKKFKKECKILLLGPCLSAARLIYSLRHRLGRVRQIDHRQADEDYPPGRLHSERARLIPWHSLQERPRVCPGHRPGDAQNRRGLRQLLEQSAPHF